MFTPHAPGTRTGKAHAPEPSGQHAAARNHRGHQGSHCLLWKNHPAADFPPHRRNHGGSGCGDHRDRAAQFSLCPSRQAAVTPDAARGSGRPCEAPQPLPSTAPVPQGRIGLQLTANGCCDTYSLVDPDRPPDGESPARHALPAPWPRPARARPPLSFEPWGACV